MNHEQYKQWYASVDFIQENMQFYSFEDFVRNSLVIRRLFNEMERHEQKLYQWYVFSGVLAYKHKCIVWDFLNGAVDYVDLVHTNTLTRELYKDLEQRNI